MHPNRALSAGGGYRRPVSSTRSGLTLYFEAVERRSLDVSDLREASAAKLPPPRTPAPRVKVTQADGGQAIEPILTSYEAGSFLVDRLGAGLVIDRDLAVVLLDLRRRLIGEYGDAPAAMMLIDRAVAAYQDFIRVTGWTGNTALMVEAEFFGRDRPRAGLRDRHGEIRGLTVEEYINRLGQDLIPLAERCARVMREALAALEATRGAPSQAVERSRAARISVVFEPRPPD